MRPFILFGLLIAHFIPVAGGSIFDLISSGADVRELTISLPLDSIYAKTNTKQDAWLTFTDETGLDQRWPLHVGVRGKFRRRTCTLPPLKLDFDKGDLEAYGLSRHDKLKLVVPCQEGEAYENLVIREYLTYQIYADLTPYHFRTQLLALTLVDVHGNWPDQTLMAFVIEDTDEMAERLGGEEVDNLLGLPANHWNRDGEMAHSLAQFLIGNHDYSLTMVRNIKQVRIRETGLLVPVAYDFDFSQLVYAPYATINSTAGQESFSDRIYLGYPVTDEELTSMLERIEYQRRDVIKMVRQSKLLSYDDRYQMADRLQNGFNTLRRVLRSNAEESIYTSLSGRENTAIGSESDDSLGRD